MRPAILLALLPAFAACVPVTEGGLRDPAGAPSAETRIVDVDVTASRLNVRMSDGARCVAERPAGETGGWSGITADCGYQLPYAVTFRQGGSASRFLIEDPTGVRIGGDGVPGPRAEVIVTDVSGQRRLFVVSLGGNVRFTPAPLPAPTPAG